MDKHWEKAEKHTAKFEATFDIVTLGKKREIKEVPQKEEKTKKILIPKCQVDYDIVTNAKLKHIKIVRKPEKVILPYFPIYLLISIRNLKSSHRIR